MPSTPSHVPLAALHPFSTTPEHPSRHWYSRGYLPHRDETNLVQAITFRLADSLPQEKLRQLEINLASLPESDRDQQRRQTIETWLDAGAGCCALRHPRLAETMQAGLFLSDGQRYRLLAWCIMPNHVHVVIQANHPLGDILRSWKSYTGRWALAHNMELKLGIPGQSLWMREYWDRYLRDETHLRRTVDYIHNNPVVANLCRKPEDWPYSSARLLGTSGPSPA